MNRTIPGFFVVLTLLAACAAPGGGSQGASPPDDRDDGGGSGNIEHPGATEPILVVENSGGFVPVQFMATQLPALVILGDGRVIMQGAQTLEFPGPALPALMERTLTEDGIQDVLRTIEDTGLFTSDVELNGAQGVVADAANTIFTLNAGGEKVTVSVYGLGAVLPDMEPPPGMTSGEIEAHRILVRLNEGLTTLDTWLPATAWGSEGWQPFEPEALRLYVRDVTGEPIDGGGLPEHVREWPTDDDPTAFGQDETFFGDGTRCGVVDGELGALWLEELNAATQMTRWTTDGENRFSVMARPILPHEDPACPELAGGA
jgi:hypothetical protein